MDPSKSPEQAIASNRNLARRARRYADNLTADADRARLLGYADELEKEADALEDEATQQAAAPQEKG